MDLYWLSALLWIIPIAIVAGIIYLIVRPRRNQGITSQQALVAYFYFVMAASIITMAVGLVFFIKLALDQASNGGEIADDLTIASVLLGIGLVIYLLHVYGRRTVEKRAEEASSTQRRIYLFSMLGIFSLVGLVSLPLAIYQTVRYFTVDSYYRQPFGYHRPLPSGEIAVAIVFVLLWAYFMFRAFQEMKPKNKGETGKIENEHPESPEI